nr:zinc finger, CCHC-type, retrotransposon Gag domain protein [Tanacetum cinerariifolium]
TSFRPSDVGGNPPPVTIHTWLERFNKQKHHSFEKAQLPWMRRIGSLTWRRSSMLWVVKMLLRQDWLYISLRRFLRLAGFLGAAAGTKEEQAKNFQWGLHRSTLNHLICMSYTDVAQVANAARNYEILHERDDEDNERPDKRGVVLSSPGVPLRATPIQFALLVD